MSKWIRKFIINKVGSIHPLVAVEWKTKLSAMYLLIGWHLFGYTMYTLWKKEYPDIKTASQYAKVLGINNAKLANLKELNIEDMDNYSNLPSLHNGNNENNETLQ